MFREISLSVKKRMQYLENIDNLEQNNQEQDGFEKLRQIPPETGKFISLIASTALEGNWLEIGTSGGYSGLWLSLACKLKQQKLTTFELNPNKIKIAKETFHKTATEDYINIIEGNVLNTLHNYQNISFCFLDAEKKIYKDCYEIVLPNMVSGGLLLADNVISHKRFLKSMINKTMKDSRVDALVVPIGKGILMCRKL